MGDKLKQYLYFDELIEYKRLDEPIQEYIDEFERRVRKLKAVNCELPDPVLAHIVIKNANLSEEAKATIKASATDFSYTQMKDSMWIVYSRTRSRPDIRSGPVRSGIRLILTRSGPVRFYL